MPRRRSTLWLVGWLFLSCCAGALHARAQDAGGIRGVIVDADFEDPVREAVVRILETDARMESGPDGHFMFQHLAPGAYTLTVAKPGYQRFIKARVVVSAGALEDVEVKLQGEFMEMEEMVVRDIQLADTTSEAGLLELRKTELSFQDSVSRDLMSKAGASDAAGALKLVVGATVMDGKYATVRGLSDRYVGAAVNGIRVPSADPKKRSVHMDIFPAGTIESLSVSKTFTPDLPGDYTGGGVNIRTIAIPEEDFVNVSYSRGIHGLYNGKRELVTYEGAGCGMWGRHLGERGMPDGLENMEADNLFAAGSSSLHNHLISDGHPTSEKFRKLDQLTRSLNPTMGVKRMEMPADYSVTVSAGDTADIGGGWQFGKTVALSYSRKWDATHYQQDNNLQMVSDLLSYSETNLSQHVRDTGQEELKWSALATVGIGKGDEHQVSLTFLRNRVASDKASMATEIHAPVNALNNRDPWQQRQSIHYAERSLDILQLRGEHDWDSLVGGDTGLELDWYIARNQSEQEEPDVRNFENWVYLNNSPTNFQYALQKPDTQSGSTQDSMTRIWRNTREDNYILGLDMAIPFRLDLQNLHGAFWGRDPGKADLDGRLKFGLARDRTFRTYSQYSFFYDFPSQNAPTKLAYGAPREPQRNPNPVNPPFDRWMYTDLNGVTHYSITPAPLRTLYNNDFNNVWLPGTQGQKYQQAVNNWEDDANKKSYNSRRPDDNWAHTFTDPENIGGGIYSNSLYWYIRPKENDVIYNGYQTFDSGYWMLELPLTKQWKVMGGARLELTDIRIDPTSDTLLFPGADSNKVFLAVLKDASGLRYVDSVPAEAGKVNLQTSVWLRAYGIVYEPMENMFVRWNYGQTMARPTFRELAPVIQQDFIDGEYFIGNQDLQISRISNYDWRWEWFPKPGDVMTLSLFRKYITDPIERIRFSSGSTTYDQAVNYEYGRISGYEFEFRKKFDFLPDPLDGLSVGFNFTRIYAKVRIPDSELTALGQYPFYHDQEFRPMEGQPEFLKNFNVSWDYPRWGTSASVFYNQTGEILKSGAGVGVNSDKDSFLTLDRYILERQTWNFSVTQKITGSLKLKFAAKNLLNPIIREVYRDRRDGTEYVYKQYQEGTSYSLGLSAAW